MTATLRKIEQQDLGALVRIYVETYKDNPDEHWTVDSAYKLLLYWFNKQPDLAYLAETDGQIVGGFLIAVKPWWDGNHLFDGELFVHPDYQKQNIGKNLLKKVLAEAVKNYNAVEMDTYTFTTDFPLNWYKRIGLGEIKEWVMLSGKVKEIIKNLNRQDDKNNHF